MFFDQLMNDDYRFTGYLKKYKPKRLLSKSCKCIPQKCFAYTGTCIKVNPRLLTCCTTSCTICPVVGRWLSVIKQWCPILLMLIYVTTLWPLFGISGLVAQRTCLSIFR